MDKTVGQVVNRILNHKFSAIFVVAYVLSLFLPFWRVTNVQTYSLVTHNGWSFIGQAYHSFALALILAVAPFVVKSRFRKVALVLFFVALLDFYLVLQLFYLRNSFSDALKGFELFKVGYYVSFVLAVGYGVSEWTENFHSRKVTVDLSVQEL